MKKPQALNDGAPMVFFENATKDKWNKKWVKAAHDSLQARVPEKKLHYREVEREHQPTPEESASFLNWVLVE